MKDQLVYVEQGQEALRKAIRILENMEGWTVELTEVCWVDVNFLLFIRTDFNQFPATVLHSKIFCILSTVIRAMGI